MKYVNPDSTHALDLHSEDQRSEDQPTSSSLSISLSHRLMIGLGLGSIALLGIWVARRGTFKEMRVRDLKIDRLEVGELHVKNHNRSSTMEESGGILRFDVGPSDVFENGLE